MVGFDPEDDFTGLAATAAARGLPKGGSYTAFLDNGPEKIRKAKIGVARQLFGFHDDISCRDVNGVIASAFEKLKSIGVTIVDVNVKGKIICLIPSLGLDALAFPDLQIPPPLFEDATNTRLETLKFPTNTFLSSLTCLPAISVPAAFP